MYTHQNETVFEITHLGVLYIVSNIIITAIEASWYSLLTNIKNNPQA